MIFVTVGSHYQGFERLVKKMDEIAGKIDENVIMQVGFTNHKPVFADYFDFGQYSKMKKLSQDARVIVSHAGVGSILTALDQRTPVIIVPRLQKFNEVIDDHQLDITKKLSNDPRITVVYDVKDLDPALNLKFLLVDRKKENTLTCSLKNYLSKI